jgi:hypothetical protein
MTRTAILLATASLLAGGCGLIEDPSPNEARLIIHGEAGKQVRVIVSTQFVAQVNELGQTRVVIFEADTLVTTLPYERTYVIEDDQRFFAEAARMDADLQTLQMQVFVDRRKEFDEGGSLLEGHPYRFLYTFNQLITQDIVIL